MALSDDVLDWAKSARGKFIVSGTVLLALVVFNFLVQFFYWFSLIIDGGSVVRMDLEAYIFPSNVWTLVLGIPASIIYVVLGTREDCCCGVCCVGCCEHNLGALCGLRAPKTRWVLAIASVLLFAASSIPIVVMIFPIWLYGDGDTLRARSDYLIGYRVFITVFGLLYIACSGAASYFLLREQRIASQPSRGGWAALDDEHVNNDNGDDDDDVL